MSRHIVPKTDLGLRPWYEAALLPWARSELQQDRDRPVVDELDLHVSPEDSGLHLRTEGGQRRGECVDEGFGDGPGSRGIPRGTATFGGVAVQRELTDHQDRCGDVARGLLVIENAQRPELFGQPLRLDRVVVVGDTDEERHRERESVRASMSFYGSTPNYAFIWDEAGFEGTTARIREKQKAGDYAGMAAQITDEHIATFATESTWDGLSDALHERYGHTATRLVLYNALADPERLERYGAVAQRLSAPR